MAVSYKIDTKLGVVFTKGSGIVTIEELKANTVLTMLHRDYRPGMDELYDFREVTDLNGIFGEGYADILDLLSVDQANEEKLKGSSLAIVTDKPNVFGLMRMYEILSEGQPRQIMVFREIKQAYIWLGLPMPENRSIGTNPGINSTRTHPNC